MTAHQHKTIKWGIIGLGNIAHKFAQDLLTIEDAELLGVGSRSQNTADEFATTYKAKYAYGSYEALAKNPDIDAIYIATPHSYHKENTIMCLKHGKAVLCEKPFAMNLDEVEDMIAVAKENNVLLMEALWTYFLPHYQEVLNILSNETYGKVLKMEADFGFTRPFNNNARLFNKSLGGGSLLDIGIYPIFAALSTLGLPLEIEASCTKFDNGADSSCDMIFSYKNNVKAELKSTLIKDTPTSCTFYCEHGTVHINTQFHAPSSITIKTDKKEETTDFTGHTNGYNFETLHFNALLRAGKTESDIMTFNFSRNLIQTLDRVRTLIDLNY